MLISAVLLVLACAGSALAQPVQLNISQDLEPLGISQNATPNTPARDTRPLLQAAIQYASNNGISKIVADPGVYWFLTAQRTDRYLILNGISDLTIDFQGSDIYLKTNFTVGFELDNCTRVTLANFTVDYMTLPFTQVRLTGVGGRTLSYETIGGWPSPTTLRSRDGSTDYWGLVLRGGNVIPNTGRLPLNTPTDGGALQVKTETSPWTQPAVLNTYQAGDIIAVTLRDGEAPILVSNGDSIVLTGIDVYASGSLGVHLDGTKNSHVLNVRVLPRPGTDRLISTNADGIHFSYVQANNHVQGNYVTRTMDDGIALNSPFLAFVDRTRDSRNLSINRNFQARIPNGTSIAFINPNTGETFGPYTLVNQSPAFESASNTGTNATYTFDNDLPSLQTGFGLYLADASTRGQNSVVEGNIVEDVLFGRGMYLGGVNGVILRKNTIRRTNCGGIVLHHDLAAYPSAPNQNILITTNTIDGAIGPAAVGTGSIVAFGAIQVLSTDTNFVPLTSQTSTNITISNNYISNAGRSGIWASNIDGGAIVGNSIANSNVYPELALWGVTNTYANQLRQDFTQTVLLRSSRNVNVKNP